MRLRCLGQVDRPTPLHHSGDFMGTASKVRFQAPKQPLKQGALDAGRAEGYYKTAHMVYPLRLMWKYEWGILNRPAWTSRTARPGWVSWALGFVGPNQNDLTSFPLDTPPMPPKHLDTAYGSPGLIWRPDAVGGLLWLRPFRVCCQMIWVLPLHSFPFTISTPVQITFLFWQFQGIAIPKWWKGTKMEQSFRDCRHSIQPI